MIKLIFRNSLKSVALKINPLLKIKMKTRQEYVKLKSLSGSGFYFRNVELFVVSETIEQRILGFQMDEKYSALANSLGSEITHRIKEKIKGRKIS